MIQSSNDIISLFLSTFSGKIPVIGVSLWSLIVVQLIHVDLWVYIGLHLRAASSGKFQKL